MNEAQNIFSRHEIKYIVTDGQRAAVEGAVAGNMRPDKHGESTVISLYLDTPDKLLARRCLLRPEYKQKLRLRSYGPAGPSDRVFLELKEKYGDLSYKRRIQLPEREAMAFARSGGPLPDGQIARELIWARSALPGLAPAICVSSRRRAFFSSLEGEDIRVTLDRDIRWRDYDLSLTAEPEGETLLPDGLSVLEVKTAAAMPLWLAEELSALRLYRTGFSKYGGAYAAQQSKKIKGDGICA